MTRFIEIPGPSIVQLDSIAVAGYKPVRIEERGALEPELEIVLSGGTRLTIKGHGAQVLWGALKALALSVEPAQSKPS